jgi:hypothetical protein
MPAACHPRLRARLQLRRQPRADAERPDLSAVKGQPAGQALDHPVAFGDPPSAPRFHQPRQPDRRQDRAGAEAGDEPEHRVEEKQHEEEEQREGSIHQRRRPATAQKPPYHLDVVQSRADPALALGEGLPGGGCDEGAGDPPAGARQEPGPSRVGGSHGQQRQRQRHRQRHQRLDAARVQHPPVDLHHVQRRGEKRRETAG